MTATNLKKRVMSDIQDLPENRVREVIDFISYLKVREDEWFIQYVNKRGIEAQAERKAGKNLLKLKDLQKEYQ